ncbi:MAG: TolC family protein [Prevotella sp.]
MRKILVLLAFAALELSAKETLTLQQCLKIGIENNLQLQTSRNEIIKGCHNISENRSRLLPQINAAFGLNDNFTPPVSVTDGTAYGKQYNVTKTLQYNSSAAIQLQMPLYNKTLYTALDISKTLDRINRLSYEKACEDLIVQISQMYFLAQNTAEQIRLVKENIRRLEGLRDITVAFYDNGMAVEVDVKRVNINIENLSVQRDNAISMLGQQYNMLKYVMDYPADEEIELTPVNPDETIKAQLTGVSTSLYELQLLEKKQTLAEQQKKMAKEGYLPSLSLSGNFALTAYTDKFKNWFHSGESNHWYDSNGIGLSLRIPVFDGFEKRSKIRKAQVDIDNAKLAYENATKSFQTQYLNATNEMMNSERNFKKQLDNYNLAQDVYDVTADQYREGVTSMTAVLQDEMRVSEAQNNYLSAHYNYQIANLNLLKITGQLKALTGR